MQEPKRALENTAPICQICRAVIHQPILSTNLNEGREEMRAGGKKGGMKKRRKEIVYRKETIYSAVLHVLFQKNRVIKNESYRD